MIWLATTLKFQARECLERAIKQDPILTPYGNGVGRYGSSLKERKERFWKERAEFENPDTRILQEIAFCMDWIREARWGKTKKANTEVTSYGLKHKVEQWIRHNWPGGSYCYISNGCFIAAASGLGFKYRPLEEMDLNVHFFAKTKWENSLVPERLEFLPDYEDMRRHLKNGLPLQTLGKSQKSC